MSSSYNFKDNLTIDNNKYLKWLDITGTSRANIISLDNVNNVKINSAFGNLVLNSESNNSYTFLNVNGNVSGVIIGSKIGIGFNTTTNMNAALTLNKNNFIGINTTTGSNDGYLGLSGTSSLNSTGSRIILYGNESSSSNNGKLNLYAGNTSNGTINLFTADDKMRFQILNSGTLNVLPDGITSRLIINDTSSTFTNNVILSSGTESTNATTGALTVSGGIGVTGSVYILGSLSLTTTSTGNLNFSSSNPSTSYSSGAIVLTGGLGIYNSVNATSVTAGGGLSIAGGAAIGKDVYIGGKFKILDSTSATSSDTASVVLYGGLGVNSNILSRSDLSPQIKLSPTTDRSETSISFYSKNNFTSTSNTGSSWTLGQNVNSVSSGNFAIANSQFGNVLSAEYSGKISILGNVYIDSQTLKIPKGTTDQRPVSAEQGFIRYNSELEQFEGYGSGNLWGSLGGGGGGSATTAGNIIANSINLGVSNMFSGSFTPSNNIPTSTNVTGLYFNNSDIRSFIINLTASITRTVGGNLYEYFTLEGNQKDSGWELLVSSMGDISGFNFTITSLGQIQYTSTNITNYTSSLLRYHVNEITNTGTYDRSGLETQGTLITNTMQILNTQDVNIGVNNGALYVAGGVTIAKTLYISSGTATISNITSSNVVGTNISGGTISGTTFTGGSLSLSGNLNVAGTLTVVNITATNLMDTNLTAGIARITTNLAAIGNSNTVGAIYTTGGNVGIGTTSPGTTLDVNGIIKSRNYVAVQTSAVTVASYYVNDNSILGWSFGLDTDTSFKIKGGQPGGNQFTNNASAPTRFTINTGGNVGIGTTAPSYTLDINGTTRINTTRGVLIGSSADIDGGRLISALDSTMPNNGSRYITFGKANGTYNQAEIIYKHVADGSTSNYIGLGVHSTPTVAVNGAGNVGIGTTAPSSILDIVSSSPILQIRDTSLGSGKIYFGNSSHGVGRNASISTLTDGNDVTVWTNGASGSVGFATSLTERMRITPAGNVGIGTAAPSANLHVIGNTRTNSIEMNAGGGAKQFASGIQGGGAATGTTSFPFTFTNIPVVVASISQNDNGSVFGVQITSISTTGFSYRKTFYRFANGYGGEAVSEHFYWIAIG